MSGGLNKPIYLRPFVSRGEVFMLPDDPDPKVLPLQLFRGYKGIGMRVGNTMIMFEENGSFQGTHILIPRNADEKVYHDLTEECRRDFRGRNPSTSFYPKNTPGYTFEVAGWKEREIEGWDDEG